MLQTTGNVLVGGNMSISSNIQIQGDMVVHGSFCVNDLRFNELSLMSDLNVHGETHLENTLTTPHIQVEHLQTNNLESHGNVLIEQDLRVDGDIILGGRIQSSIKADVQQLVLSSPFICSSGSYIDLDGFSLTTQNSGPYMIHFNVEHMSSGTNQTNTYAFRVGDVVVVERSDTVVNFGHPQIVSLVWHQYLESGTVVRVQMRTNGSKSTVIRGNFILQSLQ